MDYGFDFVEMGMRYADEKFREITRRAKDIEEEYGETARVEFEKGVSQARGIYFEDDTSEISVESLFEATDNIGVPNLRNNSYFGRPGVSSKYVMDGGMPVYADPEKKGKGK